MTTDENTQQNPGNPRNRQNISSQENNNDRVGDGIRALRSGRGLKMKQRGGEHCGRGGRGGRGGHRQRRGFCENWQGFHSNNP